MNKETGPGAWVRKHRRAAGMTQIELARAMNKAQATISRWEADVDSMSLADAEALAGVFRGKGVAPEPPPGLSAEGRARARLRGYVSEGGVIAPAPGGAQEVPAPEGLGAAALAAYRVKTDALPPFGAGWLVFTPARKAGDDFADAVGRFSVVSTAESGMVLGWLREAGSRGRFVIDRPWAPALIGAAVAFAAPVLVIMPI